MCRKGVFVMLLAITFAACQKQEVNRNAVEIAHLHDSMENLTDVIVHDIFSPPVASRIYAYPSIAAYEIMAASDSGYVPLAGQLTGLKPIPEPQGDVVPELAAIEAFNEIGRALIFSEDRIKNFKDSILLDIQEKGLRGELYNNSIAYGDSVAAHILRWADKDNYKQSRTYMKHTVSNKEGTWQPTPPAYMEAIEPHWNSIRPFVIDSANQFTPERPTHFSMEEGSPFLEEVMEVYNVVNDLTEEQAEIASFWDCNPYVMNVHGHVMFATKKITPGGHWMGIAKIAVETAKSDFTESTMTYALTSIALADGFISCWDEKYRSNLIRPETVINKYIDEEWVPMLQTPPFPEYTSGHSVISGAAGEALTSIYGDKFHFVDDTESKYGLPIREYDSFRQASDEAAISRLYGGIHYMPAIENGVSQGRALGNYVVDKLKFRKE